MKEFDILLDIGLLINVILPVFPLLMHYLINNISVLVALVVRLVSSHGLIVIIAHFSTKPQTLGVNAKGKFPPLFEVNVFPKKYFSVNLLTLEFKANFCRRPQKTHFMLPKT